MKHNLLALITLFLPLIVMAQPNITWQKSLGGSEDDHARSIKQTSDGGYIVAGLTRSNDGNVSDNIVGARSIWVVKLDAAGNIQWEKTYGGNDYDEANEIQQTVDGGYILIGSSESDDFIGTNLGNQDIIILRLDVNGILVWGKRYGGSGMDLGQSIQQTPDGGFIATGYIASSVATLWVAKLDTNGDIASSWSNSLFNIDWYEIGLSVDQTTDGGYVIAGYATFYNATTFTYNQEALVMKFDANSNVVWQNTFGGTGTEIVRSIKQTSDGGYIVAGSTDSMDGDVASGYGQTDFWVLKLDATGNIQWEKTYGGSQFDVAFSIRETTDSGYVLVGHTSSDDNDVSGNPGTNVYDYWVIKISSVGVLLWQNCLGGSANDFGTSILQTADDGYIVAGRAFSNNNDVSGNNGRYDFWVVKLEDDTLNINNVLMEGVVAVYPNPVSKTLYISSDYQVDRIELIDIFGKKILSSYYNYMIDVSSFKSGMYLMKIYTDKGSVTKKIIFNH